MYPRVEVLDKLSDDEYTYGATLSPAMEITDHEEAKAYFDELVRQNMKRWGQALERATEVTKINLGYFAGYYDNETMARVNKLFATTHPIFGNIAPTPKEAFELGKKLGESMKRDD